MTARQAKVSEHGAAVFLTDEDLRKLGIDPASEDAVSLTIEHDGLTLEPTQG